MTRTLVATCGNCRAGDDTFGPRLGAYLRDRRPAAVDVVDLDIRPAALLDHLPGPDRLVLADAVCIPGGQPGRIVLVDLARDQLPVLLHDDAMSTHGLGLADQLALAGRLGLLPGEVWLVGAIVGDFDQESPPSSWMDEAVADAARRIDGLVSRGDPSRRRGTSGAPSRDRRSVPGNPRRA